MATIADLMVKVGVDGGAAESGIRGIGSFIQGRGATILGAAGVAAGAAISRGVFQNIQMDAATDRMAAQIGLTEDVSERVGNTAGDLFADAYGESIGQVNDALTGIHRNIGDVGNISDTELKAMGADALSLADVLEEDVSRVTRGVGQIMRNDLAPDAESAFDLIARASQSPANATGDLIDTIEEYSADFSALGLSGPQAMGAIGSAVEAGARNTDLAADAFREFGIRAIDGSDASREAVEDLGMDYGELAQTIAGGGPAAAKATSQVINALGGVGNKVRQEQIGVALFGTRFEELGMTAIGAMDPLASSLGGVDGAAGQLGNTLRENAQTDIETWRRKADQMLMQATQMPGAMGGASTAAIGLGSALVPIGGDLGMLAIGMRGVGGLIPGLVKGFATIGRSFLKLSAILLTNPWVLLGAAVIALVVVIVKNWDKIVATVQSAWRSITNFVGRLRDAVVNLVSSMASTARRRVVNGFSAVVSFFTGLPGSVAGALGGLLGTVGGMFSDAFGAAVDSIQAWIPTIMSWVDSIPDQIKYAFFNAGSILWNAGWDIIQGLIDGISSQVGNLKGYLGDIGGWITSWKGPEDYDRQLLIPAGTAIMEGLIGGISGQVPALQDQLGDITGDVEAGVEASVNPRVRASVPGREDGELTIRGDGSARADFLLEELRAAIRREGGDPQVVLGAS